MNRRKALKSVLALTAAAPAVALGKPKPADDLVTRESAESYANVVAEAWARTYEKNLPRPGTFEWAMQRMREGETVTRREIPDQGPELHYWMHLAGNHLIKARSIGRELVSQPTLVNGFSAANMLATDWEIVA